MKKTIIKIMMFLNKVLFSYFHPKWKEYYNLCDAEKINASKSSDTIFIFGSGFSINNISDHEFRYFESHNTLSFNWFVYQEFLNIDYHLVREFLPDMKDIFSLNEKLNTYTSCVSSPYYKNTTFLLQDDLLGVVSFELLRRFVFPKRSKIYLFNTHSRRKSAYPPKNLNRGLVHSAGTLTDCISFGYSLGYKKIVLVGVDLYDRRYFWLNDNETRDGDLHRGSKYSDIHNTALPMVNVLKNWNKKFIDEGIQLYVYNPKSLLAEFLPVYEIEEQRNR